MDISNMRVPTDDPKVQAEVKKHLITLIESGDILDFTRNTEITDCWDEAELCLRRIDTGVRQVKFRVRLKEVQS